LTLFTVMTRQESAARRTATRREEILDAARAILARDGSGGLSMRKVAERIDCSATAIYLHFENRDDLVSCVCEETMSGLARELQQVADCNADPLVALRKALRRYVEFGLRHPEHYQTAFIVPRGDRRRSEAGALSLVRRLVDDCVKKKRVARVDVHATSCALWAAVHGITSARIAMPGFRWGNADKAVDQLIAMLVDGLRPA
jgi:AcrR family transcriptional regulator